LKAPSEAYTQRVRARIGGLRFGGLTYMPDAIQIAGNILSTRYDEQRFLIVVSDGWPYGYQNIQAALSETIKGMEKKAIILIGVGVETDRMKNLFKLSSEVNDQRDLIKKFAKIYQDASTNALEV
jgi:Mg-chelatase subunit ChlD